MLSRRIRKGTLFLRSESDIQTAVLIASLSEPLDDLTLSLLNLDTEGKLLLDVVGGNSPVKLCQQRLCACSHPLSDVLDLIWGQFNLTTARKKEISGKIRAVLLELSSEVYWRIELYFDRWPFNLLDAINGRSHPSEDLPG